jgi:hypothetical protein
MDVSALAARLLFLALPGLLATAIYRKLRGRPARAKWEDLLEILLFSLLAYSVYALVAYGGSPWPEAAERSSSGSPSRASEGPVFVRAVLDEEVPLAWLEIAWASGVAVVLAFGASYVHKFKVINRLARWLRASRRSSDEDMWEYLFDSPNARWVLVRDLARELAYYGYVRGYSESEKPRELILEKVLVCRNTDGERLYEADIIYLARDGNDLSIEVATPLPSIGDYRNEEAP